ncbi:MAG: glutamine synthetase III [Planctomycetota bacterium]|nr:glutamine synthetase III [Planctomycetota bacterium]
MAACERKSVQAMFGSNVFSDVVMRERLPKNAYRDLKRAMEEGHELSPALADVVANAMKDWAIEKGAAHFCPWFQPMTGVTAEKHDSFISPTPDGRTIMEFSGRELIKGEPDASSFPSGGLRATFEARGYTAWDCTSPVFVKEDGENVTLYIPSAFCSYTGEALDKKTPLLRSMEALSRQAIRVLRAFGNTTARRVTATLGAEQEYFLLDRKYFERRLDLMLTGRTLFGAQPPKGQEMEDHYFGSLPERVASFMREVNEELWKLGVSAKTQHKEVAPGQYEIAPVFTTVNIASDHNQLTMNTLEKVALRHGLVCLLHEKPFAGVNGSGKHNNWSIHADDGQNLLDPGKTPHENAQFLIFLCALLRAVDRYAPLLRASVATAGNDHRLGANEAPPAIISIFLGDQLTDILEQLERGGARRSKGGGVLKIGVSHLPPLPKDSTDRNRTSPLAFTGNKFEFRMVGASMSCAKPMYILNTIVADALKEIADELEGARDVNAKAQKILQKIAREHKRIVFDGNNYSEEWVEEARRRGLPNLKNAVDVLAVLKEKETLDLFERHCVLSRREMLARHEILLEAYSKTINIEALTASSMVRRQILPAASEYAGNLARQMAALRDAGEKTGFAKKALADVSGRIERVVERLEKLEAAQREASKVEGAEKRAAAFRDRVVPAMAELRAEVDALEAVVDARLWPLPTYAEMLFSR